MLHTTTGIVLLAHHPQASAFEVFVHHVHGADRHSLLAVDVVDNADRAALVAQTQTRVLAQGWKQVLVLVDLPGASPYHIALKLAGILTMPVRLVTGINNAMLLAALQHAGTNPRSTG